MREKISSAEIPDIQKYLMENTMLNPKVTFKGPKTNCANIMAPINKIEYIVTYL